MMVFELAGGSVIGRDHIITNRTNQDAWHFVVVNDCVVASVCDGCGEDPHPYSHIGAHIGCRYVVQMLTTYIRRKPKTRELLEARFWERLQADLLAHIRLTAEQMGESVNRIVREHFLFTIVGALITPEIGIFFSFGDGVIVVNDTVHLLGPYPGNKPPYIALSITGTDMDTSLLQFVLHPVLPAEEINSFLLGSDGVEKLIANESQKVPGQKGIIGPLEQFWMSDIYFSNPYAIGNRLALINRAKETIDWQSQRVIKEVGPLTDDTTLIVGRRK